MRATRAVRLVHRAHPLCTAPSWLHAMFTLTFVYTNTHAPRYFEVASYNQWGGVGTFPAIPAYGGVSQVEVYMWGEPQFTISR
jgi:hypothetical protein